MPFDIKALHRKDGVAMFHIFFGLTIFKWLMPKSWIIFFLHQGYKDFTLKATTNILADEPNDRT
jgi:hypothetical protein